MCWSEQLKIFVTTGARCFHLITPNENVDTLFAPQNLSTDSFMRDSVPNVTKVFNQGGHVRHDEDKELCLLDKKSIGYLSGDGVTPFVGLEQSAILSGKGPEYLRDLLGFLKPVQQSPKSRWVRCFSAKRDGWAARTFYEKCNGKAPNIVLVSVGGRYVFGGYSDVAWTMSDRGWQSSSKSFLYTLCNKNGYRPEKLPLRDPPDRIAIRDHTSCGPVFGGGGDLFIADNAGGNEESYTEPHTYARPQGVTSDGPCDVFAGTWSFTPDEMEVFHEVVD
ncbi:predicted protein [Nematostella vectensis]|uniref:TLDc domain-containing protein n=1 Tax=Nematostella vectensis TaxID=45351 RepID=A7SQY4_NEMVE|nr:predicted protein [Nematostella vectensis]|eukprot:XP_001625989.1 predicted protein [Nematostella vectensis]